MGQPEMVKSGGGDDKPITRGGSNGSYSGVCRSDRG